MRPLRRNLHVLVVWVGAGAARVADFRPQNASRRSEQRVGPPKASHAESGRLVLAVDVVRQALAADFFALRRTNLEIIFMKLKSLN